MLPDDEPENPPKKSLIPDEWLRMSEEKEIAEGDVSVSETADGHDPLPALDDDEEETAPNDAPPDEDLD